MLLLSQISTKTSRSSESSTQTQFAPPMLDMDTVILHSQAGQVAWEHHLPSTWDPHPGAQTGSSKPHYQQSLALPLRQQLLSKYLKLKHPPTCWPWQIARAWPNPHCSLKISLTQGTSHTSTPARQLTNRQESSTAKPPLAGRHCRVCNPSLGEAAEQQNCTQQL